MAILQQAGLYYNLYMANIENVYIIINHVMEKVLCLVMFPGNAL